MSNVVAGYSDYLTGIKSPHTIRNYLTVVEEFMTRLNGKPLPETDIEDVIRFKAGLFDRGVKATTIANKLSALASFVSYLRKVKRLALPLTAEDIKGLRPPVPNAIPGYLEPWEIGSLIRAAEDVEDEVILRLLYTTGIRSAELLGITREDIGIEQKEDGQEVMWLKVHGKGSKDRRLPVNHETAQTVERYLMYREVKGRIMDHRLFPISYKTLWYRLNKIAARAGVRKVTPHLLRHSFATELLNNEESTDLMTINVMLGHASLNTTKRYTKVKPKLTVRAVNSLKIPEGEGPTVTDKG